MEDKGKKEEKGKDKGRTPNDGRIKKEGGRGVRRREERTVETR